MTLLLLQELHKKALTDAFTAIERSAKKKINLSVNENKIYVSLQDNRKPTLLGN